jgi:hypothetical protein
LIYFLQATDGGPVKIGYSANVPGRVRQLETHYGKPMAVLATMDGDRDEERAIHARFAHLRLDGPGSRGVQPEQFRPAPDLMTFIGRPFLVGPNPDSVEVMDDGRVSVKIARSLASKAKLVAAHRGIPAAELLSSMLEAPIDRAYAAMLRELDAKGEVK